MNGNSGQFKSQQELERKASVIILEFNNAFCMKGIQNTIMVTLRVTYSSTYFTRK